MTKEEVVSLFRRHDRWWKELQNMESITWSQIPWPTLRVPRIIEDLSTSAIDAYVQSPHYPDDGSKSARDRIKAQIRKWHPDRFDNLILRKVIEEDRERVQEAAGTVVRDLNELLNRRSKADALFGG
ncbi:hypothetical protein WOLCODRAFT_77617 [Wolfiporia cocos MD-104 SS10]|uniref:J domain-containing protein n=1 Tax=Wolfiporia cocos (strain MD-104) TaxID=742152 RepID=A0A2H3JSZ6_WOLCO|nr:hypothetical protein WOLCODRAFT_77617 [Wolfiporia cocos MD-104 SS10]